MNKIRVKLLKCDSKLSFIRLIKVCTGLGLRDSKDIADELFNSPGLYKEITLLENEVVDGVHYNYYKDFIEEIHKLGEFEVIGGLSWERNLKMLVLGIGDLDEYTSFLSEYMSFNNSEDNKIILEKIISKLKKEDLIEIVEKIK
jgi:hypothetical protein